MADSQLSLTIPGRLEELARLADVIEVHCAERGWPDGWSMKINLSLEELVTNVVRYGYGEEGFGGEADASGREIHISLTEHDDSLEIEMEDDGIEFNPFEEASVPDVTLNLEERPIGGLGVMFVKTFMDEVAWARVDGRNRITLILHGIKEGTG